MDRRAFIGTGLKATAAATLLGRSFWREALASHRTFTVASETVYGPLAASNVGGTNIFMPPGFTARVIARANDLIGETPYPWHVFPDGGATYATTDDGWIYVSNSETPGTGGASAVRFDAQGEIESAYRILGGTSMNCAGGPTPWGTWLSCEERPGGMVWECDPNGLVPARAYPAMGLFSHEAVAIDGAGKAYLTEDDSGGRFYRFTPTTPGDLSAGTLEAAAVDVLERTVTWLPVNPLLATQQRPAGSTRFIGGEGCWYDAPADTVYFTTKGDNSVWAYSVADNKLELLLSRDSVPGSPLSGVDNIVVSSSGDIFVCEDGGNMEIVMVSRENTVAPLVRVVESGSEIAGVAFDPSGSRMYFSSQRGGPRGLGVTFEVTGPFRTTR